MSQLEKLLYILSRRTFLRAQNCDSLPAHRKMGGMSNPLETYDDNPIGLLGRWIAEATASEPNDPCAAALATATPQGHPSVRMVLVKSFDQDGLSFYTNTNSRKGRELETNPFASLCFHWKALRRQIRVEGSVSQLPVDVVDRYFHSRSKGSQIAAAVSKQSEPLESREQLANQAAELARELDGNDVPLPVDWRGYLLKPAAIEFWADGKDRLHDRVLFRAGSHGWTNERLYP